MKKHLLKILKNAVAAFLLWFGLTLFLVVLGSSTGLDEKLGWFPAFSVLVPIFLAAFYIARAFYGGGTKSQKKPTAKTAAPSAPSPETSFSPTGDPQLDAAMAIVDAMEGHDFEQFCAELLERCGYKNVHVTKGSGDQGVDIIAIKNGVRYAFQCKRYSSRLGNKPVQEVHTGKQFYSCAKGVVITNNYFTRGAEDAARRVGVELWDRDTLIRKMGYQVPTGKIKAK